MKQNAESEIVTLCRRWRYLDAKLKADVILVGEHDDDEMDRIVTEANAEQQGIVDHLCQCEPETIEEALALMRVIAVAMEESTTIAPDHRKLFGLAIKAVVRAS